MAEVRNVEVSPASGMADPPIDTEELYGELKSDPMLSTPDMQVRGNWTYRQLAGHITAKEFVEGKSVDWEKFRGVEWEATPNLLASEALINFGSPASRDSSFGSGDPGIGVNCGNGYYAYGRSGSTSALVYNGNTVMAPDRGSRGVEWNAPNNVDLAQMIVQFGWGYQMSAVAAILTDLPGIGNSTTWRVPAYNTDDGPMTFVSAYSYSYSLAPLGMPMFQSTFDIKPADDMTMTFALVDAGGSQVTATDVDIPADGQSVKISWVNAPSAGNIALYSDGTGYTIDSTSVTPPTV